MSVNLNLLNSKLELIQWLSTIEDSSIIEKIMDLRKNYGFKKKRKHRLVEFNY